jgi:ferredoxin--NADP+ reductase
MKFRFLASPRRVLADANNHVRALEIEETKLEPKGQDFAAVGLKEFYEFPCDSVVFAVGDKVDESVGLPCRNGAFITNPVQTGNDPDDALFQAYDEKTGKVLPGIFLTGWARKASEGLVGIAKRDGEWCTEVLMRYLESKSPRERVEIDEIISRLRSLLAERRSQTVNVECLRLLEAGEKEQARGHDCLGEFKLSSNEEMLALIQRRRDSSTVPVAR